jgi:hypothetical protein
VQPAVVPGADLHLPALRTFFLACGPQTAGGTLTFFAIATAFAAPTGTAPPYRAGCLLRVLAQSGQCQRIAGWLHRLGGGRKPIRRHDLPGLPHPADHC